MERRHIFELENGKFAVVNEEGCSCYDVVEADIDIYPNLDFAKLAYKRLRD